MTEITNPLTVGLAQLEALIAEWRRQCVVTEQEIASGLRAQHAEGPRYGIAAVEACADQLEAPLGDLRQQIQQLQQEHDEVMDILKPGSLHRPAPDGGWEDVPTTLKDRAINTVLALEAESDHADENGRTIKELRQQIHQLQQDNDLLRDTVAELSEPAEERIAELRQQIHQQRSRMIHLEQQILEGGQERDDLRDELEKAQRALAARSQGIQPEDRAKILELLEDVYDTHREKDSLDTDWLVDGHNVLVKDEPCGWCVDAKPLIEKLKSQGILPQEEQQS